MITTDFTETPFRIESRLTTNEQTITIDLENKVIFTTPFIEGVISQNVSSAFAGMVNDPETVNFVVDGLTIISTNPDVENQLPLRVKINDKYIPYTDPTSNVLTDYKIINLPPNNISRVVNHRFNDRTTVNFDIVDGSTYILTSIKSDTTHLYFIYMRDDRTPPFRLASYSLTSPLDDVPLTIDVGYEPMDLISDGTTVFILGFQPATPNNIRLYLASPADPQTQIVLDPLLGGTRILVDYMMSNGILYLLVNTTNGPVIYIITKQNGYKQSGYYEFDIGDDAVNFVIVNDLAYILTRNGRIYTSQFNGAFNLPTISSFDTGLRAIARSYLAVGGSDRPVFNVICETAFDNGVAQAVNRFTYNESDDRYVLENLIRLPIAANANQFTERYLRLYNRYLNQVYYMSIYGKMVTFNCDTADIEDYLPTNLGHALFTAVNMNSIRLIFGTSYVDDNADAPPNLNRGVITWMDNERNNNVVISLRYDYIERTTYSTLNANTFSVRFELPDGRDIRELEIIKYIMDLRIRYSTKSIDRDKITADPTNRTGRRRRLNHLSVDDVLGRVDNDFELNDFLKIYSI